MDNAYLKSGFSVEKAHKAQLFLSKFIIFEDKLPNKICHIAGVDTAYIGDLAISAVVVLDYNRFNIVEVQTATCKTVFPYVPTLLSFRELPPTLLCMKKLKMQPDILLVDGHGFAHPYRCGFASHLGIVLGIPTIGAAKSRLTGEAGEFTEDGFVYLRHKGEIVGAAVKTPTGRMVYVSVGHMVSLQTAMQIVKHCIRHSSLPEPIRKAHQMAKVEKKRIQKRLGISKFVPHNCKI